MYYRDMMSTFSKFQIHKYTNNRISNMISCPTRKKEGKDPFFISNFYQVLLYNKLQHMHRESIQSELKIMKKKSMKKS